MEEPFAVTNPSARLLRRMAILLCVNVGHLLGESIETDPVLTASNATWHSWVGQTEGLDARIAVEIRTEWVEQHRKEWQQRRSLRSERSIGAREAMQELDWEERYQLRTRKSLGLGQEEKPRLSVQRRA
jgi:hypothetical protein